MAPSVTLVSGFLDIGRDKWPTIFNRSVETYMGYMRNVLKLQNDMVIFTQTRFIKEINEIRFKFVPDFRTKVIPFNIEDCKLWSRRDDIEKIMESYKTRKWSRPEMAKRAPEYLCPEYDIIMAQKLEWVKDARNLDLSENRPLSDYYCWIDAGFTHSGVPLANRKVIAYPEWKGKVYMTRLSAQDFPVKLDDFITAYPIELLDGGFIGIDKDVLDDIYTRYYALLSASLDSGLIDDDQTYFTFLSRYSNDLFWTPIGPWWNAADMFYPFLPRLAK